MMDRSDVHAVELSLWVGPAPACPEDYSLLRDLGVEDVVSLQTQDEACSVGLRPDVSFRLATTHGLREHRVPIEDFSHRDLAQRAWEAVVLLADLRGRGRKVYLHCRAGLNRSPTVAAAFLAWSRGLTARAACETVREVHPGAMPDEEAVVATLKELARRSGRRA